MIGEQVLGYRVDEAIGSGSFGTVYKVSKTNASGTYVRALKHIKLPATKQQYNSVLNSMGGDYSKADDYFAAALRETVDEIRILSMLSESGVTNIVRYYENDIVETSHPKTYNIYMMMEYLTPFPDIIETRTMTVGEVIRLGKDILKALISCHQKNIIHRDIKDDNIFVNADGVYKLGDFGVSKKLKDKSRAASMRGTPNFIAPEVYLGKESYDCTVDLYSLGIVLYRLLNKLRGPFLPAFPAPYTSDDENTAFEARISGQIPTLPLMAQNSLGEAVCKAIMPRDRRYSSAQEFLDALEKAESELSRDAWLTPAYEVYFAEEDTDAKGKPGNTSTSNANKTVGGLQFETEEDEPIRVGKNLFGTIGSDRMDLISKQDTPKTAVQPDSKEKKDRRTPDASEENKPEVQSTPPAVPDQPENTDKTTEEGKEKQKFDFFKKRGPVAVLAACLAAAIVAGMIFWAVLGSPLTIAGKKTDRDATSIWLDNVTVTTEDMVAMAKLKDLRILTIKNSVLTNEVMSQLKNLSPTLRSVEIYNCTGVTDYSGLSTIPNLNSLTLDNVQLTDEQLANMFPTVPSELGVVDISNNPSLTDLSGLASAVSLMELDVSNTAVRDFSALQNCKALHRIQAQNNGITNLKSLSGLTSLRSLDLGNNRITRIEDLVSLNSLEYLYLNNNQISSLSVLRQTGNLKLLDISDNLVTSLEPLVSHVNLEKLYANHNSLTNLEGLEQAISLKVLEAAENEIEDITGMSNCAILEDVNLSYNQITDISLLGKSAGTLKKLYFHHNCVSDISALSGTSKLKYLGFDYNGVTDLDALSESVSLEVLSAAHNEIQSINGLKNATKLRYIYLNHNLITDMNPVAVFSESVTDGVAVLDLSNNQITELQLAPGQKYSVLSVYNNPITSFAAAVEAKGRTIYLSYVENGEYAGLKENYNYVVMAGCPLDQQYHMTQVIIGVDYLSPYLEFVNADELDKLLYEEKSAFSEAVGYIMEYDTQNTPEDTEPTETTSPTETELDAGTWRINYTTVTIHVGDSIQLRLENDADRVAEAVWNADRSGIVWVSGNTVTGAAEGVVTVSATVDGQTYSCVVYVVATPPATQAPTEETTPATQPAEPPETQPTETEAPESTESQGAAPAYYSIWASSGAVYPGVTFYVTVNPDVSDYTQIVIHAIDPKGGAWNFVISSGNSMPLVVTEFDLTGTWTIYADVYNEYGVLYGAASGARTYIEVLPLF